MKVISESEVALSRPTLSDPIDCSPPGSSVHGIFQARVLEWGAIAFSSLNPAVVFNWSPCLHFDFSNPDSLYRAIGGILLTFISNHNFFIKIFQLFPYKLKVKFRNNSGLYSLGPRCLLYLISAAATAKSLQLCPTLCNPIDGSLLSSPVPGILQARTLEWVAISFSNA